jgi:hypothetical protein
MGLQAEVIERISKQVCRDYPEMRGARPSISGQGGNFVLTFRGKVRTSSGAEMSRIVRAVADEDGRVIKISTSK